MREETTTCLAKTVAVAVRTVVVVAVVEELLFVEAEAIAEEDPKKEAVVEAVENIVEVIEKRRYRLLDSHSFFIIRSCRRR